MFDKIKKNTAQEERLKAGERIMGFVNKYIDLLQKEDMSLLEAEGIVSLVAKQLEIKKNRFLQETKISIWDKKE